MTCIKPAIRVGVYVDGYNLYYGRLRGSAYKWLDLVALLDEVLARRDQNESLAKVNLFTAYALARFSGHDAASVEAQSTSLRALALHHGARFEAVFGSHTCDPGGALMPEHVAGEPYDRRRRVRVWRIEEKKTDVNFAVRVYRDVCKGLYERIVIMTNDRAISNLNRNTGLLNWRFRTGASGYPRRLPEHLHWLDHADPTVEPGGLRPSPTMHVIGGTGRLGLESPQR